MKNKFKKLLGIVFLSSVFSSEGYYFRKAIVPPTEKELAEWALFDKISLGIMSARSVLDLQNLSREYDAYLLKIAPFSFSDFFLSTICLSQMTPKNALRILRLSIKANVIKPKAINLAEFLSADGYSYAISPVIVKELCENGCDVNASYSRDLSLWPAYSALSWAIFQGPSSAQTIDVLLEMGANVNQGDVNIAPLDCVCSSVKLIAGPWYPQYIAMLNRVAKKLISKGAGVHKNSLEMLRSARDLKDSVGKKQIDALLKILQKAPILKS